VRVGKEGQSGTRAAALTSTNRASLTPGGTAQDQCGVTERRKESLHGRYPD